MSVNAERWLGQWGSPSTMETSSGLPFDLLNPQPTDITADDIDNGLNVARFGGQQKPQFRRKFGYYTVKMHSIGVAAIVYRMTGGSQQAILRALLHDAHEAYVGDVIRPLKYLLGDSYRQIADRVQSAIEEAFGLGPPSDDERRIVKDADNIMCRLESSIVMASGGEHWDWPGVPREAESVFWRSLLSANQFLMLLEEPSLVRWNCGTP